MNKDFVILNWEKPENDGGSSIQSYKIDKKDTNKLNFMNAGSVSSDSFEFKVTKLIDGHEYLFRVVAENAVGESKPVEISEPVKARLPFGMVEFIYNINYKFHTFTNSRSSQSPKKS